jgi:hypothetical protein
MADRNTKQEMYFDIHYWCKLETVQFNLKNGDREQGRNEPMIWNKGACLAATLHLSAAGNVPLTGLRPDAASTWHLAGLYAARELEIFHKITRLSYLTPEGLMSGRMMKKWVGLEVPLWTCCQKVLALILGLSWVRFFRGFPQSFRANTGRIHRSGHHCSLPNPFQFIVHLSSHHPTLYTLDTEKVSLNNP